MNIVYLYTEIMPYVAIQFKELSKLGHKVLAFNKYKLTPYQPPKIQNIEYDKLESYTKDSLLTRVINFNPDILLVCGWSEKKYLHVARYYKKKTNIPVVCPIDTQYIGRLKQILGFITAPFYVKKFYTHIWVPGVRQFHFASLMGFKPSQILLNSLTGNTKLFQQVDIEAKKKDYPKTILFVGRYNKVKGLDILLKAWNSIENKNGWKIVLAGNGPLKDRLLNLPNVDVLDFQPQERLVELAQNSGVFVLPSVYEPWALVLQEFAAAGLPIICSDACGAASHMVINGFNGYTFKSKDIQDLKRRLLSIIKKDTEDLYRMSVRSRQLSYFTNPEISVASLLSAKEL